MMTRIVARNPFPFLFLALGGLLVAAAAYFMLLDSGSRIATVPREVAYSAPELTLTDIEGRSHSLADYRGQVLLVNLWATWCPPCREEMPALQSFYNKYRDQGFVVIAINAGDPAAEVQQFVNDYGLTFPVWLDPTSRATELSFKTLSLPSSFVIDRQETVRLQWIGGVSRRMLEQHVTPLILEKP